MKLISNPTIDITDPEVDMVRLAVAERLGWRDIGYTGDSVLVGHRPGKKILALIPSYAKDIRAAWEIVEFLLLQDINVSLKSKRLRRTINVYVVELADKTQTPIAVVNRTASLAICLAFIAKETPDRAKT